VNRTFQLAILNKCYDAYPNPLEWKQIIRLYKTYYVAEEIPDDDDDLEEAFMRIGVIVISDDFDNSRDERRKVLEPPTKLLAAINYLEEHELLRCQKTYHGQIIPDATITAKGIDFLADDGGLSAVLNTVTVKFDIDNIRKLVEIGLINAHVPKNKQNILKKAVKEAPNTILQTAVSTIVGQGMSNPAGTAKAVGELFGIKW